MAHFIYEAQKVQHRCNIALMDRQGFSIRTLKQSDVVVDTLRAVGSPELKAVSSGPVAVARPSVVIKYRTD